MVEITVPLVRRLIATQFPAWADLPIKPVATGGWDNRTFHLGDHMSVRLPSAERYVPAVEKEQRWLPKLAPALPLPIPQPVGLGAPNDDYPWPWSVYAWLDGDTIGPDFAPNSQFAADLASFLTALQAADTTGVPPAGAHNFHRGGDLSVYDDETRQAIATLADDIDAHTATTVWNTALATTWDKPPVWVHGDVAAGNLLVKDGRLCAVIDFGSAAIGDPSCDLVPAWTLLDAQNRATFKAALNLDPATWARARGWALWKALITITSDATPKTAAAAKQVIQDVLADPPA